MVRTINLNKSWAERDDLLDNSNLKELDYKTIKKVYFIVDLYDGLNIKEASKRHYIEYKTGLRWKNEWNEGGFDGLKRKKGSGAKSKLNDKQLQTVFKMIKEKKILTKQQIRAFIKSEFEIEYSPRQIDRIAKKNSNVDT